MSDSKHHLPLTPIHPQPSIAGSTARYFIGLELQGSNGCVRGSLVRVFGRGLESSTDVLSTASCGDQRVEQVLQSWKQSEQQLDEVEQAALLSEAAADVVASLVAPLNPDYGTLLCVGLLDFGIWKELPLEGWRFLPRCDTAMISKLTGLTVIDDFPGRDLAWAGRGGPVDAAGKWLLLADPGAIPGRRIRALIDIDETVQFLLLPPRQVGQIPAHLMSFDLTPGLNLMDAIAKRLLPDRSIEDPQGKLAVQGRHARSLLEDWKQDLQTASLLWTPRGHSPDLLLQTFERWAANHRVELHDILCTCVHLIADQVAEHIRTRLPKSQPVGQIVLSGRARENGFLVREMQRRLPEIDIASVDELAIPGDFLRAVAAAMLALFNVDQIPANSSALTGTDAPRILGRITPGNPSNWHQVMTQMSRTLPDKLPLRSVI